MNQISFYEGLILNTALQIVKLAVHSPAHQQAFASYLIPLRDALDLAYPQEGQPASTPPPMFQPGVHVAIDNPGQPG